jgi:hypothetical protein
MNKINRNLGLLAVLPLLLAVISVGNIDEAEAGFSHKKVVLPEPEPIVELTLKQVFEPQKSNVPVKVIGQHVVKDSNPDATTFRVIYSVSNSGETDVKNIMISVQSDIETVDAELFGWLDEDHSVISVLVQAVDPSSIKGKIVGYEV